MTVLLPFPRASFAGISPPAAAAPPDACGIVILPAGVERAEPRPLPLRALLALRRPRAVEGTEG